MKIWIGLAVFAAAMCWAQGPDETKLRAAMKVAGATHGAMGKKILAKDDTAAADAKKLEGAFKGDTHAFFVEMKASDGVEFSKAAAEAYAGVAKALAAGDWAEAGASHKKASATCMGCHTAHRTKEADGSYKVK